MRIFQHMPLQLRIMLDFVIVIIVLAVSIFALGSHVIRREIMDRTQDEVQNHLKAVRAVYYQELSNIRTGLDLIDFVDDIPALKDKLGLDYLYRVPLAERGRTGNEIVEAAFAGNSSGGTRLIAHQEAAKIGLRPERKQPILIRATPLARPTDKQYLDTLMSIEYARPVYRYGKVESVVYGGRVLNNNAGLIDAMHRVVFKNQYYGNKPTGTVTVFQDDVRVATNVVDEDGERAIGTRVSEAVYHNVIEEGRTWIDRAFVVTDWYVTAYEPIYSIDGRRIGILYVGMLEAPYKDRAAYIGRQYLWIVTAAMVFGMIVALILTVTITRPLNAFVRATDRIAHGELDYRVGTHSRIRELNSVGESVNSMAGRLKERETALNISNGKLRELNRSYLDMISTVTHEIKGMLSSVMLNTHGMKDEIYGPVTETQEKVLRQIIRNLDYFAATVKNFFNLSRIEKGEMVLHRRDVKIDEDVFDNALATFHKLAADKALKIEKDYEPDLIANADPDLLTMAVNNLVGNAVKYCPQAGTITLRSRNDGGKAVLSVISDGEPIPIEERDKLFKKFSRLDTTLTRQAKGTGLGLFITQEIANKHGGCVDYRAHERRNEFALTLSGELVPQTV